MKFFVNQGKEIGKTIHTKIYALNTPFLQLKVIILSHLNHKTKTHFLHRETAFSWM